MSYRQRSPRNIDIAEVWEKSYKEALTRSSGDQAGFLLETIGPRITAAALGLADARQIKAWARFDTEPREHAVVGRLALLYRIVYAIVKTEGANVAALFLRSSNPQLDDDVPLMLIRESDPDRTQGKLLAATRAFVEG